MENMNFGIEKYVLINVFRFLGMNVLADEVARQNDFNIISKYIDIAYKKAKELKSESALFEMSLHKLIY